MTELKNLRAHLRGATPIGLESVTVDLPVACIDGRRTEPTVGVPGGSTGMFLLMTHTLERVRGVALNETTLEALLVGYASAFGSVYLHSDEDAVSRLAEAVSRDGEGRTWAEALIRRPPAGLHRKLLEKLVLPEHIGCGHIQSMQSDAAGYGLRPTLVSEVLRSFFRRLWSGHRRFVFDVLRGSHAESALLQIGSGSSAADSLLPVSPCTDSGQLLVHHPEAASFLMRRQAAFLAGSRRIAPSDEQRFVGLQETTYGRWLSRTKDRLFRDVPIFEFEPERASD